MEKILIVDDSSLVRRRLGDLFGSYGYECYYAKNGQEAVLMATEQNYDAITMDINMPVMGGLEAIKLIMQKNPTPILVISSLTVEGANETFEALDLGAVDYVSKPEQYRIDLENDKENILFKLRAVISVPRAKLKTKQETPTLTTTSSTTASKELSRPLESSLDVKKIILIGSSTGGPGLIEQLCVALPKDFPYPVCVVQHMPEQFTSSFSARLNSLCDIEVQESEHNQEIKSGVVYIAKGGTHMQFRKTVSGKITIRHGTSSVHRFFTPSVDEMYLSALEIFEPKNINAILLTGIGDDGADGITKIKERGGWTIGESEESCIVYGMPRVAYEKGGISKQMDFADILSYVLSLA